MISATPRRLNVSINEARSATERVQRSSLAISTAPTWRPWTAPMTRCHPGRYCEAVSYADSRPGRRRRGGPRLTDKTLNVALGAELRRRIDAAADRYGCAAGMVARYAIEPAGLPEVLARLEAST